MKTQSFKLFDMPGRYANWMARERIRREAALRYSVTSVSQLVPCAHVPVLAAEERCCTASVGLKGKDSLARSRKSVLLFLFWARRCFI